jgi:hypothetical protein
MQRIMRKSGICPLVERENKIDVLMGFWVLKFKYLKVFRFFL